MFTGFVEQVAVELGELAGLVLVAPRWLLHGVDDGQQALLAVRHVAVGRVRLLVLGRRAALAAQTAAQHHHHDDQRHQSRHQAQNQHPVLPSPANNVHHPDITLLQFSVANRTSFIIITKYFAGLLFHETVGILPGKNKKKTAMSSLPLNLGTNGFTCLPKHSRGQSKSIKDLSI